MDEELCNEMLDDMDFHYNGEVSENRRNAAKADEDGGGGDEEYEINSMGKPVRTGL